MTPTQQTTKQQTRLMALRKEKQAPVATTEAEANAITTNVSEKIETETRTDSLAEKAEAVVVASSTIPPSMTKRRRQAGRSVSSQSSMLATTLPKMAQTIISNTTIMSVAAEVAAKVAASRASNDIIATRMELLRKESRKDNKMTVMQVAMSHANINRGRISHTIATSENTTRLETMKRMNPIKKRQAVAEAAVKAAVVVVEEVVETLKTLIRPKKRDIKIKIISRTRAVVEDAEVEVVAKEEAAARTTMEMASSNTNMHRRVVVMAAEVADADEVAKTTVSTMNLVNTTNPAKEIVIMTKSPT